MASKDQIILRLEGSRAKRGVSLSDFETFIESFLAAVRDLDRETRGAELKKSGHPERRAEAVTALRLVKFRTGSGVATLEPETSEIGADPLFEPVPPPIEGLTRLVERVAGSEPVPSVVTSDLERAIRAFGPDGSVDIHMPKRLDVPRVKLTSETIDDLRDRAPQPATTEVSSVSGRLHLLDTEPDRIGIRSTDGVEWLCHYPEDLESTVLGFAGKIVWATGTGERQSARRGLLELQTIRNVDPGDQSLLFTEIPVPFDELRLRQGVSGPQESEALAATTWDEDDDVFLEALTGD